MVGCWKDILCTKAEKTFESESGQGKGHCCWKVIELQTMRLQAENWEYHSLVGKVGFGSTQLNDAKDGWLRQGLKSKASQLSVEGDADIGTWVVRLTNEIRSLTSRQIEFD